jgi:hypothetical protein
VTWYARLIPAEQEDEIRRFLGIEAAKEMHG